MTPDDRAADRCERVLYFQTQTRFHRDSDGSILSPVSYARHENWAAYLGGFDRVVLLARVAPQTKNGGYRVEGPAVTVEPMPYFHGIRQLVLALPRLAQFVHRLPHDRGAVYGGRAADPMTTLLERKARKHGVHCIVQVVGDPAEAARAGSFGLVGKTFAPLAQWWVRHQVKTATAVIYVTRSVLQSRYPSAPGAVTVARSNVELSSASFADKPRDYGFSPISTPAKLITVGGHDQKFKGHDLLLDAIAELRAAGILCELSIVGGGRHHQYYTDYARSLGLADCVTFTGQVSDPAEVRRLISQADLFVLPSLTEGLPRALLEAMAQGVACIGSDVGGNSELLDPDAVFSAGSAQAVARQIEKALDHSGDMTRWARHGYETSLLVSREQSGPRVLSRFVEKLLVSEPDHGPRKQRSSRG